ncbi:unnamed protein product [Bursaphelenchus okinawaensis]|uniref:Mpv17-like protein n=1 Tax=Bursaphelenchus okinawaensis TaxID=465554 RepID=A0A811LPF0_9BILA|nr:unnamed protein product [Bursaphelenchus okinawaensis]CAG9125597.1 unnamed protein product [Bursaphelenchus okinawaensis]
MSLLQILSWLRRGFSGRNVIYTNTVLTVVISGSADVVEQRIINKNVDLKRSVKVGMSGLLLGPMNTLWYNMLDKSLPGKTKSHVFKKVLLDIVVSPLFASTFICSVAVLEGSSATDAFNEYCNKFLDVLKLDICFWPPVQTVNFLLLQPKYRVLYVLCTMFFYSTILTYIKHKP